MSRKHRLLLTVTILWLVSALMVQPALAKRPAGPACMIGFQSELDDTESRYHWRYGTYYTMPVTGGYASLVLGTYVDQGLGKEALLNRQDVLSWVQVCISDRDDPARVLFQYSGSVQGLWSQPGVQMIFGGERSGMATIRLQVPGGVTWWQCRIDTVSADGRLSHADTALIVGGLAAWRERHDGATDLTDRPI